MYIIGITGGTGAGKTLALSSLKELGALTLDCDKIYHDLLIDNADMKSEIEMYFSGTVTTDGKVDRKKLREIVWESPSSLEKLNEITHKYVVDDIKNRIELFGEKGGKIVAIDAIALIESGISEKCNIVVGIISEKSNRIARITKRDNISETEAQARINVQQPDGYYKKNCHHIIKNDFASSAEFYEKCKDYFNDLITNNAM